MTYHLDAARFGNPDVPLSMGVEGQTLWETVGGVGAAIARSLNPTAPVPLQLVYRWNGEQVVDWRTRWEDPTRLNWGANWFTADLPLAIDYAMEADPALFPYDATAGVFVGLVLENSGANHLGYVRPPAFADVGSSTLDKFAGATLTRLSMNRNTNNFVCQFGDGEQVRGVTAFDMLDHPTGERVNLTWRGSDYRTDSVPSVANAWDSAGEGAERPVSLFMGVQSFQRYRVHLTAPYSLSRVGFDQYNVTLPVEVDVSVPLGSVWGVV